MEKTRLVYLVTVPSTADVLLEGQLAHMREHGFHVTVVSSPGPELERVAQREGVQTIAIPMVRAIHPIHDLLALLRLVSLFRELRPDIVNASTPKAGLLGMVGAWLTRAPVRIYLLRGLRFETTRGWRRQLLRAAEVLTAACAHRVVCISESLRGEAVDQGLFSRDKSTVFLAGSSNGIDADRFSVDRLAPEAVGQLAKDLGIPEGCPVIGYVGRLSNDKGVVDVLDLYDTLRLQRSDLRLLLIGELDSSDPLPAAAIQRIRTDPQILWPGFLKVTAAHYALMTVLAFPSRREGFGNVLVEAAAAGCPVVGYDVTGVKDAVAHGVTGTLVPPRDHAGFLAAVLAYLSDPALARRHGANGVRRAREAFARGPLWECWEREYRQQLAVQSSRRRGSRRGGVE